MKTNTIRNTSILLLIVALAWGCSGGGGDKDSSGPRLVWEATTTYTDGINVMPISPPNYLAGYRIYYGADNELHNFLDMSASVTSISIQSLNLKPGKYSFYVTALAHLDGVDQESIPSNAVSTDIL